jgi:beta-xylosidase
MKLTKWNLKHVLFLFLVGTMVLLNGIVYGQKQDEIEDGAPEELDSPQVQHSDLTGIGLEEGFRRQDPSNVVKVGDTYYVWYSRVKEGPNTPIDRGAYYGSIWYATSEDGVHWTEQGQALAPSTSDAWDDFGVLTPFTAKIDGRYYLFYSAVESPHGPELTHHTKIGVATAESPDGPWTKFNGNPILTPSREPGRFDEQLVDDAWVLVREGQYWLYFKGREQGKSTNETQIGLARAEDPLGPYEKYEGNPVTEGGHTPQAWPHREGVALWTDSAGDKGNAIWYAPDGFHFERVTTVSNPERYIGSAAYCDSCYEDVEYGRGIEWGVTAHRHPEGYWYLERFDVDLQAPKQENAE